MPAITNTYRVSYAQRVISRLAVCPENESANILVCLGTELDPNDKIGVYRDDESEHIVQVISSGHFAFFVESPIPEQAEAGNFTPHYLVTFLFGAECANSPLIRRVINSQAASG